jgi:hypothetical protein
LPLKRLSRSVSPFRTSITPSTPKTSTHIVHRNTSATMRGCFSLQRNLCSYGWEMNKIIERKEQPGNRQ